MYELSTSPSQTVLIFCLTLFDYGICTLFTGYISCINSKEDSQAAGHQEADRPVAD